MDFKEATLAVIEGRSIRRKSWPDMIHLKMVKNNIGMTEQTTIKCYRQEVVPFQYHPAIILSNDWIVIGDEELQVPFAFAVERLKKRKRIKLSTWDDHTYLELSENGKEMVMRRICDYEYTPTFECFSATDWEIME